MNGEDLADKGQGQTLHYSSNIPERESLRLVGLAREILGCLAPLLFLWLKKLS